MKTNRMETTKKVLIWIWIIRLIAAIILIQTLFFKFSAADESVYIFSKLGMEPYGRIGSGIVELIAAIAILWPKTSSYGALIGLGVMSGAIISHLTILGVVVQNDGGQLFILACVVWLCCMALIWFQKQQIISLFHKLLKT